MAAPCGIWHLMNRMRKNAQALTICA